MTELRTFKTGLRKGLFRECRGFTANLESFGVFEQKDDGELTFVQHSIFYRRDEDQEVERFCIAHEFGHCALHWPLGDRRSRRKFCSIHNIGRFYLVDFDTKEEEEADVFACLLGVHRPAPKRSQTITVTKDVQRTMAEFARRGILRSPKL